MPLTVKVLENADGYELGVANNATVASTAKSILMAGSDGTNARFLATTSNGSTKTVADAWKAIIHNNATITSSGSATITGLGYSEWYLLINLKNAPTGTLPTIRFKVEELDPVDLTSVFELKETGITHTIAEKESLNIKELDGDTVKISWTVTGAGASWTGVNVAWVGHVSGNAIEGMSEVGSLATDAPVPIALVDQDGYVQRIRGDALGNIGVAANLITAYSPDPKNYVSIPQPITSDPSGQLITRSAILTDEGSFRDDFSGSSLLTNLTGTFNFTNGSTSVTGTGTLFTSKLSTDNYIRISAHANSALALVSEVISDTQLVLDSAYTGATASSTAISSDWFISIPASPANITVGSSLVNLIASTVNGAIVSILRSGDYLPFTMLATLSISQRIVNQTICIGFQDIIGTPEQQACFVFDGTDSSKVKCRSSFASDSIQETLITIPSGILTSASNVFQIDQGSEGTVFIINGTQVASHQIHLPGPYNSLNQIVYIQNTGTTASLTTFSIDSIFFQNRDAIALDQPVTIQGAPGGIPVNIQFGTPGGGTALPKIININFNKSEGAILANAYKRVTTYTVPAAYSGYLIKFVSFQGEVAVSRVVAETNMGTHNNNTNVFTAGSSYASPQWVPVIQAEVTTLYTAGSGNVVLTVGYTNETGTSGRSGTITIPKGSVVGSRFDLVLQGADLGVQSIQSCSGTPSQNGISKLLGLLQLALHQDQSTTTQTETLYAPGAITFPAGTMLGMEYAGGTVSKSRLLDMLVQLIQ